MRRLLVLVSAIVLVDTSFYAAITPLLPYYAAHENLTKASAGVLAGAYPAGTMLAAIPAAAIVSRVGARAVLVFGLVLLSVTSLTFGLAHSIVVLDLARFFQGMGGALTWTGGMGWLSGAAPPDRRAGMMGTALGAATAGAMLGPVLGAVARATGPGAAFAFIAAVALVLLVVALRTPVPELGDVGGRGSMRAAVRNPLIAKGAWFVGCTALFFGVFDVLLPLHMDSVGASGAVIAITFLVGAGLEAIVNPLVGRRADRRGWVGIARFGLVALAVFSLLASLPDTVAPLVLVGVAAAPFVGVLWIPGMALLGEGSDRAGVDHAYAYAVMNLAWAASQTIGSAGGGALARATSDFVPYACVAATALVTLALAVRVRTGARERAVAAS